LAKRELGLGELVRHLHKLRWGREEQVSSAGTETVMG